MTTREHLTMYQKNLNTENLCPSGTCSNGAPIVHELPVNEGAWLKIEEDMNSSGISHRVCKKALVSLHVTLEDSEHECSLAPYCKNHPIQKCLKDQERAKGQNNDF
ncbi:MAG: hypothetical protein WCP36_10235 [Methanomicrobiales archaeon]